LVFLNFPAQNLYFHLQFFVFVNFAAQEAGGDPGFGFEAGGGQDVGVAGFVRALMEVLGFYPAFGNQGFEAIVDYTETDTLNPGERPLRKMRIFLQVFEKFVSYIVIEFSVRHMFGFKILKFWA
jgi:hypothetical protein